MIIKNNLESRNKGTIIVINKWNITIDELEWVKTKNCKCCKYYGEHNLYCLLVVR
jgi:hypothetical protein